MDNFVPVYGSNRQSFRYYKCISLNQKGYDACLVKWVPAGEIEKWVFKRLAFLWEHPAVIEKALKNAQEQASAMVPALKRQLVEKWEEGKRAHQES